VNYPALQRGVFPLMPPPTPQDKNTTSWLWVVERYGSIPSLSGARRRQWTMVDYHVPGRGGSHARPPGRSPAHKKHTYKKLHDAEESQASK